MSDYPGLSRQESTPSSEEKNQRATFEWVKAQREEYLESLRENSCYPAYRSLIGIFRTIGIISIAIGALSILGTFLSQRDPLILLSLLGLGLGYYFISILKDAAHMVADISDAVIDANLVSFNSMRVTKEERIEPSTKMEVMTEE